MIVRKVSLVALFGLSLVLVGITLYRVVAVIDRHSEQQFRSLLASLEILAAATVSNALVLGSFLRDRGAKKPRFRIGSVAGNSSLDRAAGNRRETITVRHWGSDADLVGDVGMRLQEGLSADERSHPRPAPMAIPLASQALNLTPSVGNRDWASQEQSSVDTDEIETISGHKGVEKASSTTKKKAPSRHRSFFDVGGLLDDTDTISPPLYPTSTRQSHASSANFLQRTETEEFTLHRNRQGKHALLQDIGGLLTSEPAATPDRQQPEHSATGPSRSSASARHEKTVLGPKDGEEEKPPSLQDAGGLLT